MRTHPGFVALLALFVLFGPEVWADSETRPATPAERGFADQAFKVISEAMPPAVPGWDESDRSSPPDWNFVTVGAEQYPLPVDCQAAWQDSKRLEESQIEQAKDLEAAVTTDTFQSPEMVKMSEEITSLAEAIGKAVEKGNMAEVERLNAKLMPLQEKVQKIGEAQEQATKAIVRAHRAVDAKARVAIRVNSSGQSLNRATEQPALAGGKVYRLEPEEDSDEEGTTMVFLGPWKFTQDGEMINAEAVFAPGIPHTQAQNIEIQVHAAKARADRLLSEINWEKLQAFLSGK